MSQLFVHHINIVQCASNNEIVIRIGKC
jgi:hypothetical protein